MPKLAPFDVKDSILSFYQVTKLFTLSVRLSPDIWFLHGSNLQLKESQTVYCVEH